MQRIKLLMIILVAALSASIATGEARPEEIKDDTSHSVEVEAFLTNGLVYRYRHEDQNFSVGLGRHHSRPDKLDALLSYQTTYAFGIPVEGIFYRWSRERGKKTLDDFGSVRVTSLAYYVGVGSWFKPKIHGGFYLPISFGVDYPVFKQSRFESDDTEDFSTNDRKKISVYFRVGGGYEF